MVVRVARSPAGPERERSEMSIFEAFRRAIGQSFERHEELRLLGAVALQLGGFALFLEVEGGELVFER